MKSGWRDLMIINEKGKKKLKRSNLHNWNSMDPRSPNLKTKKKI